MTIKGFVNLYNLVFIHLDTRKIIVSSSTANPDSAWVTAQTQEFVRQLPERHPFELIHDRDTKFSAQFRKAV